MSITTVIAESLAGREHVLITCVSPVSSRVVDSWIHVLSSLCLWHLDQGLALRDTQKMFDELK